MRPLLLFLALLAGCIPLRPETIVVPTNPSPRPLWPKPPHEVAIVSTPPARPFAEVGLVEGHAMSALENDPHGVLWSMRSTAGSYGCDALMITGANNVDRGWRFRWTSLGYHGVCLVFPDAVKPPPPAETAAPADTTPPALLFRNTEGSLYRVAPESRDRALRAGWVQVGTESPGGSRTTNR
jgi:hypothetical protein